MAQEEEQSQEEYERMLSELSQRFQTKDSLYFYMLNKIVSASSSRFDFTVDLDDIFIQKALLYIELSPVTAHS